jgi:hypothetical protein
MTTDGQRAHAQIPSLLRVRPPKMTTAYRRFVDLDRHGSSYAKP